MMRIKITSYVRVSIILEPMKDQSNCNIKTINQTSINKRTRHFKFITLATQKTRVCFILNLLTARAWNNSEENKFY